MKKGIRIIKGEIHENHRHSGVDEDGEMWATPDFDYFLDEPEPCAICEEMPKFDVYINVIDGRIICSHHVITK